MTNTTGASITGEPASEPTVARDAEADLKTAHAKVPHHRGRSFPRFGARLVSGIVTSGRHCGQATRSAFLRTQRSRLRLPRRRSGSRHPRPRRPRVEVPVLLSADRLPGVVRPRQVALVLPSRRGRRPQRRVRGYVVDVDLGRTARGALSFVVLGIVGIVLGVVLTIGALALVVWLYESWLKPSLGA